MNGLGSASSVTAPVSASGGAVFVGELPAFTTGALCSGVTLNFVNVAVLKPTPPALSQYSPATTVGWRNTVCGLPSWTHAPGTPALFGACSAVTVLPRRMSRNHRVFCVTPFRLAVPPPGFVRHT